MKQIDELGEEKVDMPGHATKVSYRFSEKNNGLRSLNCAKYSPQDQAHKTP